MMKYCRWFILFVLLTVSGCHGSGNGSAVHVATDFESGSIGEVLIISDGELELSLANDNHNPDLPKRWRNWWYVRIADLVNYGVLWSNFLDKTRPLSQMF